MKKNELEKMLMDPEGVKKLSERALAIRQRRGEGTGAPAARTHRYGPQVEAHRPTSEEVLTNDSDYTTKSGLTRDLASFIPGMENADAKAVLRLLTQRTRKEETTLNLSLLEAAINRVVGRGEGDEDLEKLVQGAIEILEAAGKPKEGGKR